jgi:putative DNA primase/helicase
MFDTTTSEGRIALLRAEQAAKKSNGRRAGNGTTAYRNEIDEFLRRSPEPEAERVPEDWPAPQPISDGLLPVPQLPVALIPAAFRGWIHDIAGRLQVPLDFPAVPAIVAVASAIGNQVGIRPKAHDDWTVTPNLWGAIVGRPGTMKSPAILEALKPLNRLVAEAKKQHEQALKDWKFDKEANSTKKPLKSSGRPNAMR